MPFSYSRTFQKLFKPLEPIPTGVKPVLREIGPLRAVLFDLYGTLFVSGSGDVGVLRESACRQALAEALRACGNSHIDDLSRDDLARAAMDRFLAAIDDSHQKSRENGLDFPEVDIVEIWRQVLDEIGYSHGNVDARRLAVEYEARANPIWPMPGAAECLEAIRGRGLLLGIVSNAQFYTRELFPALLAGSAEDLGFEPKLQIYSYQYGLGKPSARLFEPAVNELRKRSIDPNEVLFVGNDMLNDILPATQVGFRTALFAGDARSLRMREDDARVSKIAPDLILTELGQLNRCIIEG